MKKKEPLTEEKVNQIPHDVLASMYVKLDTSFNTLLEQNQQLIEKVSSLEETIAVMNQQLFGRKTEQLSEIMPEMETPEAPDVDAALNEAEAIADDETEEPEMETVVIRRKKKGKRTLDLQYVEEGEPVIHELTEEQLRERFPRGYTSLEPDEYTELEHIPERFIKVTHKVAVYAGNHGEGVVRADRPDRLLLNSILTPSLFAAIANGKYVNALPINRISEEYARLGVNISRQVMAGWMIKITDRYLSMIYRRIRKTMFNSRLIHCDETPFTVVKDGRAAGTDSYMWVYHTYERYGTPPIYIYEYAPTRNSDVPREFLKDFKGILVTDGYQVYHTLADERPEELRVAGCWEHAKRKFAELVKANGKKAAKGTVSAEAVHRIAAIYHVDNMCKQSTDEERQRNRSESVKPLVNAYFEWLKGIDTASMDHSGKLYKAIQYSLNQEKYLRTFLDDPMIPLDNNDAERSIRKFCVGKHSWHVIATPKGAKSSAMLYSIVETARANGLKPYAYLKYVLEYMLAHAGDAVSDYMDDIMPWSDHLPEEVREYKFD